MAVRNYETKGFITDNPVFGGTPKQKALFDLPMVSSNITLEAETVEVEGTVDGSCNVVITDEIVTRETWTMSLDVQKLRSSTIALMMGEMWEAAPNTVETHFRTVTIPAGTPYEIVDAKIAATTTALDIKATIIATGPGGLARPLEVVTTGTPTVDQVRLNAADGKLIFAAGLAGATLKYSIDEVAASGWESLGVVATPRKLDKLLFRGILCSTEPEIIMVEADLSKTGGFELPIGGDPGVTLEYRAVVKGANRSPVRMFRKAA